MSQTTIDAALLEKLIEHCDNNLINLGGIVEELRALLPAQTRFKVEAIAPIDSVFGESHKIVDSFEGNKTCGFNYFSEEHATEDCARFNRTSN